MEDENEEEKKFNYEVNAYQQEWKWRLIPIQKWNEENFYLCVLFSLSNSRISLYFASHIECNNYKSSAKIKYYQILLHSFLNIAAAIWSISWTLYWLSSLRLVMLQNCHSFQPDKHSKYIRSHFFSSLFLFKNLWIILLAYPWLYKNGNDFEQYRESI